MFKIEERNFGKTVEFRLINSNTQEYVSILPFDGATLNQVALKKGNKNYELLDGSAHYEAFILEGKSKFKGSNLFPFPNRIPEGKYRFENVSYQFPTNFPHENNAIHGIITDVRFDILHKNTSSTAAELLLQYNFTGLEEGYPFKVGLSVQFILAEDGFSCVTTIENRDNKNVPVGHGWHPYIKTGSKVDDLKLTVPTETSIEVDERLIPTGNVLRELLFNQPTLIGNTLFDTAYKLVKNSANKAFIRLDDSSLGISLLLWQETGIAKYNYVQLFTPPDRKSIAIEPMTCIANAFNNKEGLIILKPGEKTNMSFGLKLE